MVGICSGLGCRRDGAEIFRQDWRRADGEAANFLTQHLMQPRSPAGPGIEHDVLGPMAIGRATTPRGPVP